jgi:hypothetical protein
MSKVSVNLTMFEGKTRECISRAVQQKMFGWGYKWGKGAREQFTDMGYLYIDNNRVSYSRNAVPYTMRSCEYMNYTAEEFLSLTEDPLKGFEVGKPYTDNERVVICTESADACRFRGVSICNVLPWRQDELWKESEYTKCVFVPIDPSHIQIEVLPCK